MFQVKETRRAAPVRMLVHGGGGVGKSTFGAASPDALFICAEDGLANIDARALELEEGKSWTWAGVLDALEWLSETSKPRTLVVDSLDWLEPLCWAHVCELAKKKDIEAFGYGKGYNAALDQWRVFLARLRDLHERGWRVVLIAHSVRKKVQNPAGDDYDAWQIKLHEKAAGLLIEWVDVVAFAEHEVSIDDSSGRAKGKATGRRVLRCNPSAAYTAKTRYALPRALPLDWDTFAAAVAAGSRSPIVRLREELELALAEANDELREKASAFLSERGETVASLSEALETVNAYLAEQRKAG